MHVTVQTHMCVTSRIAVLIIIINIHVFMLCNTVVHSFNNSLQVGDYTHCQRYVESHGYQKTVNISRDYTGVFHCALSCYEDKNLCLRLEYKEVEEKCELWLLRDYEHLTWYRKHYLQTYIANNYFGKSS